MKAWLEGHDFEVWCSAQLSMGYPDSLNDLRKAAAFLVYSLQTIFHVKGNACIVLHELIF